MKKFFPTIHTLNIQRTKSLFGFSLPATPARQCSWLAWRAGVFVFLCFGVFVAPVNAARIAKPLPAPNSGLVGYWNFDSCDAGKTCTPNVKDLSGKGNNGTWRGTASTTVEGKIRNGMAVYGAALPGSDGFKVTSWSPSLNLTSNWTYSIWSKRINTSQNDILFGNWKNNTSQRQFEFMWTGGQLYFTIPYIKGILLANTTVADTNWHHAVATKSGTTWSIYLDGVLDGSVVDATAQEATTDESLAIGFEEYGDVGFNGSLDEARVYNRALSATEIQNLYKQGLGRIEKPLPPAKGGLVGYWNFDSCDAGKTCTPAVKDLSGNGNNGTWGGTGATTASGKLGNGASFDGTNSNVITVNSTNLQLTTGTVGAWIKTSGAGSSYRGVVIKSSAYGMFLIDNVFSIYDWGSSVVRGTGVNLADGQWHYVVETFQSGVNNGTILYIDGVARLTTTMSIGDQGFALIIGAGGPSPSSQTFNGTIDEARVYNRTLSATEIQNLYKQGLGRIEKPLPPTNGGLVGYWNFDSCDASKTCTPNVKDLSGQGNNGTWAGQASTTAHGKLKNGAGFDGSGDYITFSDTNLPSVDSSRTVTLWAKTTQTTPDVEFVSWGSASSNQRWGIGVEANKFFVEKNGAGKNVSSPIITDGIWHHLAVVYSGSGATSMYIDGIARSVTTVGSWTTLNTTLSGTANIGSMNSPVGYYTTGTLDEVRIYNRALSATEIQNLYQQGR